MTRMKLELKDNDLFETLKQPFYGNLVNIIKNNMGCNVLGLFGEFGTGKTTVLNLMDEHDFNNDDYNFIIFDSWKYEKMHGDISEHLLYEIIKKGDIPENEYLKTFKKISKVLLLTASGIGLKAVTNLSVNDVIKNFNVVESDQIHKSAQDIITKAVMNLTNAGKKKLIIAVDNLDRCMPENAIQILLSINIFFALKNMNVFFIIVADEEIISNYIQREYADVIKDGASFLEKLLDFKVYMPCLSVKQLENFAERKLTGNLELLSSCMTATSKIIQLADRLRNPRKCLKIIYSINNHIGLKPGLPSIEELLGIVACTGWSRFMNSFMKWNKDVVETFYNQKIKKVKSIDAQDPNADLYFLLRQHIDDLDKMQRFQGIIFSMREQGLI